MRDYTKLEVWQKAHSLVVKIYEITRSFPKEEKFGIVSQIRRAAVSVPANISEGSGRKSNTDLRKFLIIALGSASETEYFIRLSMDLGFIDKTTFTELCDEYVILKRQLQTFIKSLESFEKESL